MRSNYKRIGDFIELVDERNKDLSVTKLLGLSITKEFIPSVANTIGTSMANYKIIKKNQFACSVMQVRRDKKMPVALLRDFDEAIISQAYPVFEVVNKAELLPEYLMMWFSRSEFDRHACFLAVGGVRGSLEWDDFLDMELPVPSIEKQRAIVKEYNTIDNRIKLNKELNQKLEETAQALYKHWFVDFEFPNQNGQPYKSSGGKMIYNDVLDQEIPLDWFVVKIEDIATFQNGYGFKSYDLLDKPNEKTYDVFKMGHIQKGGGFKNNATKNWVSSDIEMKLEKFILKKGDILMAMTDMKESIGLLGNTSLMPEDDKYVQNQRVGLLRVDNSCGVGCNFLYTLTNSKPFLRQIRNTANYGVQVNLTSEGIRTANILIANNNINSALENKLKTIQNKIDINNNFNNTLDKLKNILLQKTSLHTQKTI